MKQLELLLKELRTGDPVIADRLRHHYTPLVEEAAYDLSDRHNRAAVEYTGSLWLGLATAIDRLSRNDVEADGVEDFIRDELDRARRSYGREKSFNILPPASTNSMRQRKGLEPYEAIRRVPEPEQVTSDDDAVTDMDAPVDFLDSLRGERHIVQGEDGVPYRPSSMVDVPKRLDQDTVEALVMDDQDRKILEMLLDTYSQAEIAAELHLKPSRVRTVINKIRERAMRLGLFLSPQKDAATETAA